MKSSKVREAIKKKSNEKTFSKRYCQKHYVDGIEYNGNMVCGFCRSIPEKIIHYLTEIINGDQKTVFYKLCPMCGDIVRIVKEYDKDTEET